MEMSEWRNCGLLVLLLLGLVPRGAMAFYYTCIGDAGVHYQEMPCRAEPARVDDAPSPPLPEMPSGWVEAPTSTKALMVYAGLLSRASDGNAEDQRLLGLAYWFGYGVDRDGKESRRWLRKAVEQGDTGAMAALAAVDSGDDIDVGRRALAQELALTAAEHGESLGYQVLAWLAMEHEDRLSNVRAILIRLQKGRVDGISGLDGAIARLERRVPGEVSPPEEMKPIPGTQVGLGKRQSSMERSAYGSERSERSSPIGAMLLLVFALLIYFAPAIVAGSRSHPNGTAIFALNFLAGWTFLGWVVAMVWALLALPGASGQKSP